MGVLVALAPRHADNHSGVSYHSHPYYVRPNLPGLAASRFGASKANARLGRRLSRNKYHDLSITILYVPQRATFSNTTVYNSMIVVSLLGSACIHIFCLQCAKLRQQCIWYSICTLCSPNNNDRTAVAINSIQTRVPYHHKPGSNKYMYNRPRCFVCSCSNISAIAPARKV